MKKNFVLLTLFFLGFAFSVFSLELENTELVKVFGTVEIKKTGMSDYKKVPGNLKLAGSLKRLDSGDTVKTSSQSGAEMVLKETCLLTVKEDSQFEIPTVVGNGLITQLKTAKGSYLFKVISGSDFKVQTADVVAGVKGTLFEVEAVDDLRTLISTPNMEIGRSSGGGTNINVYEGEVELKHVHTGALRRLKPGEGVAALSKGLSKLDTRLEGGFGPQRKFKPLERLKERFGKLGEALHSIPSNRKGLREFKGGQFGVPVGNVQPGERFGRLLEGMDGEAKEKLIQFRNLSPGLQKFGQQMQEFGQSFNNLKGDRFIPEFPPDRFPVNHGPVNIREGEVKEIHLGNGVFVSAIPGKGCKNLRLEPHNEGLRIAEGEGTFRIRDLSGELDGVVSMRKENGRMVSQVNLNQGQVMARMGGGQMETPVNPNNPVAARLGENGRQERIKPQQLRIPQQIRENRLQAENFVQQQREIHQQKVQERRGGVKDLLENRTRPFGEPGQQGQPQQFEQQGQQGRRGQPGQLDRQGQQGQRGQPWQTGQGSGQTGKLDRVGQRGQQIQRNRTKQSGQPGPDKLMNRLGEVGGNNQSGHSRLNHAPAQGESQPGKTSSTGVPNPSPPNNQNRLNALRRQGNPQSSRPSAEPAPSRQNTTQPNMPSTASPKPEERPRAGQSIPQNRPRPILNRLGR